MGAAKEPPRPGEKVKTRKALGFGRWFNQSVALLVRNGHSLRDIGGYTLTQFRMVLDAVHELEADERAAFVVDMGIVVGSLFDETGSFDKHLTSLTDAASGVKSNV